MRFSNMTFLRFVGILLFSLPLAAQVADSIAPPDTIAPEIVNEAPVDSAASASQALADSTIKVAKADSQEATAPPEVAQPGNAETDLPDSAEKRWRLTPAKVFWALLVLLAAFLTIRFLTNLLESMAERWGQFRLLIKRLIPTFRILAWTFVLYEVITVILAPPLETVIAVSAAVGLSVGLASQDILKNIFGGIIILLDRPFQVGDKIDAGGHYGEVKQIGLRTVRIVTPDDNLVSIPNADMMNQAVSNANAGEPNCQVVAEVFLPADTDTEKAREIAYLAAATSRYIFLNKPIAIIIKNEVHQGRSLFKLRLKAYVLDIRYEFPFMSEMTETVMRELLNAGLVTADELQWVNAANSEGATSD